MSRPRQFTPRPRPRPKAPAPAVITDGVHRAHAGAGRTCASILPLPLLGLLALLSLLAPGVAEGQGATGNRGGDAWDSPAARSLAERATARRAEQIADTLLHDYTATAHGFLTFLAQVGDGFPDPPRVVKADELAVRVYWLAPDLSKQLVVGRRDTLLLPADVGYYSDRYGIVQNNFPDRIRMGDGNDVRDVPHPLSAVGLKDYQFALGDSLLIRLPGRQIAVLEVKFRPVDPGQPRAVGTLYVDRESAAVVRMSLTFTRAAILDRRIETLAVTLENGLVEGRFWLPHRQELEVARTSTWLDFPARGIIRGRWEVGEYEVNKGVSATLFGGAEIVSAPPRALAEYDFDGELLAQLPGDVRAVSEADVERVRTQAEGLVRQRMLSRPPGAALSARRVSDFLRVNRVEGVALGVGTRVRLAPVSVSLRARYGVDDARLKGRVALSWGSDAPAIPGVVELFAARDHRDAGDVAEASLARNSLAAQEFGSDYTDPYEVREVGVGVPLGQRLGAGWRAELAWEEQRALGVHATPWSGEYGPTIPARGVRGARLSVRGAHPQAEGPFGSLLRWDARADGGVWEGGARTLRLSLTAQASLPVASGALVLETVAGELVGAALPQQLVYQGGPVTGAGYAFHSLAGRGGVAQRVEWQRQAPFPSIPLGRFGGTPASMTLAPFLQASAVVRPVALPGRPDRPGGVYPSVGVAGLFLFDLVRLEVARGVRDGRWTFGVDVSRTLWGIL